MRIDAYLIFAAILTITACQPEETYNSALDDTLEAALLDVSATNSLDYFLLPDAHDLSRIPQDPKNQLTPSKVALGKLLFHETGLALSPIKTIGMGNYSCASCHLAKAGFQAGRVQGIGEGGIGTGIAGEGRSKGAFYTTEEVDVQAIRTPSTLNSAYQVNQLWNGQFGATGKNINTSEQWTPDTPKAFNHLGYEGLETQAIAGLKVHRLSMDEAFLEANNYIELFNDAFPDIAIENRYSAEQAGLAIAAYERTLLANEAPFQRWLKGDLNALSDQEKQGAILFFKEGQCANCHTGPALNSMDFHALGFNDLYLCEEETFQANFSSEDNLGRGGFTKQTSDNFKFKVPQLYNLMDSPFYGHGSSFRNLLSVVQYKNNAIPENNHVAVNLLASDFRPLELSAGEISNIVVFLEKALRDPNLSRYSPSAIPSGNCFPSNDPLSRDHLNCN